MSDLLIDTADGIVTLTMNRPHARNALSPEMRAGLDDASIRLHLELLVLSHHLEEPVVRVSRCEKAVGRR